MTTFTEVFGTDTVPPSDYAYQAITLSANTQFYWPENATGSNIMADINDVTASGSYDFSLPPANQVGTGRDFLISNVGSTTFTVKDYGGGTVVSVAAGVTKFIALKDNSTTAGTWKVFTFGTGTSSADSSALAGAGLSASGAVLVQSHTTTSSNTSYAVTTADRAKALAFGSSGAVTCTLPSVATAGDGFFFMLSNQGSGGVTVDPSGVETIDGATTKDFAPGESALIHCTGSVWITVGYGRSTVFQFTKLVLDIGSGSPFTLTSTQAQNKLLQFIGSPSAAVTVNVPAVVAIYYIQCSYSGAYALTLKTASGTGVSLGNSDRIIAYCDGTNVVMAQTATATTNLSLIDGTAANPAIYFTADTNTGIFRAGAESVSIAGNGAEIARFTPSGLGLATALAVTEGGTGVATLTGIVKASGTSAFSAASAGTDYVAPGAATSSGLTMATARLVGRTTASTGALEEITVGSGLTLSSGTLSSAGGAMDSINKQQYFQGL